VRVLVAEDDEFARELLKSLLEIGGHEVVVAEDGAQAWDLFCKSPCRLVLSDWKMPGKDGLALCRLVRESPGLPYTYFMLVTGVTDRVNYLAAMAGGVDDFVAKPIDGEELAARLKVAERILGLLDEVRQLRGLLAICSYCKKIRDPEQNWQPVEQYISRRSDARFSHTICPTCIKEQGLEQYVDAV